MSMPTLVSVTLSAIQSGLSSTDPSTKSSWSWSASPSWTCARSAPSRWSANVWPGGRSFRSSICAPYSNSGSRGSPNCSFQGEERLPLLRAEPVVDVLAHLVLGDAVAFLDLAFELIAVAGDDVE